MGVIVKFPDESARQAFIEQAHRDWPELIEKTHQARRRPDAVIDDLTDDDLPRLERLVQDHGPGRIYADVQFQPLAAR